jgi:hypothetical protein
MLIIQAKGCAGSLIYYNIYAYDALGNFAIQTLN